MAYFIEAPSKRFIPFLQIAYAFNVIIMLSGVVGFLLKAHGKRRSIVFIYKLTSFIGI